ncbi:MAG: hypothetical protein ACYC1K_01930 [Minisyncoccota bacterium]
MTSEPTQPRIRSLVSAVLDDGSIVETIASPTEGTVSLIRINGDTVESGQTFDLPTLGSVRPYSPNNSLLAHGVVRFASAMEEYASEDELVEALRSFIHQYADLSEAFEEAASYYVLLTWVYDAFNELPYLRLKGDFGSGKTRCLQTIGSLCYKPMFASGASTVSPLFRIMDAFRGTLVIDESDFRFSDERTEIVKILNNGNAKGFPVLRSDTTPGKDFNPKAFDVFGPKIIATRRAFDDRALESRCITEDMTGLPPRLDIPLSLPEAFHTEAEHLRNKLLSFRARRRASFGNSVSDRDPLLEARVAQVFAPLMAVAIDPDAKNRLYQLARKTSGTLKNDRATTTEAQLLDIIAELRRNSAPLGIKDISERFSARFGSDTYRSVTPRWVGFQLRSRLSLLTVKSHGTFVVPETEDEKLQTLFVRYGISQVERSESPEREHPPEDDF